MSDTEPYPELLAHDLTAALTDAGLPPSEHGGVRGAMLLLVGLWRGERQRADEAETRLRREKSLCADANDAARHYAQRASEAEARIARVEVLHAEQPNEWWDDGCTETETFGRTECSLDFRRWPCPTIAALKSTEADR